MSAVALVATTATSEPLRWRWGAATALTAVLYVPYVIAHALCNFGLAWSLPGIEFFVLAPMAGLLILPISAAGLLFCRTRGGAAPTFATCVLFLVGFAVATFVGGRLRHMAFVGAAERARPLVAALHAYVDQHGAPPADLDALVPEHLTAMPERLPPLRLVTGDKTPSIYFGATWALEADVSSGLLNWDLWLYLPNGAYPREGFGGWFERVGDWAYVHE